MATSTSRRSTRRLSASTVLALVTALSLPALTLVSGPAANAASGIAATDLTHGASANQLVQSLVGTGVSVSHVTYTGAPNAAGSFTAGTASVGIPDGVVLSSGSVQSTDQTSDCSLKGIEGPNECSGSTTSNGTPGDADLDGLSQVTTYDAAVLEFDFVPQFSNVQFNYVFSSDEYSEYSNSPYNDVFAFFVNGNNCALLPGTSQPVSVNTINGGNPLGTNPQNPELYRDNGDASLPFEMDGETVLLTCSAAVNAGQINHLRMAIADGSDQILDSNVFIAGGSLVSGTTVSMNLSGAGETGTHITVPDNTPVTSSASIGGPASSTATGTLTYQAFTDAGCATPLGAPQTVAVTGGTAAAATPVSVGGPGVYYFTASYSGDSTHNASASACGMATAEVLGTPSVPVMTGRAYSLAADLFAFNQSAVLLPKTPDTKEVSTTVSKTVAPECARGPVTVALCSRVTANAATRTVVADAQVLRLDLALPDGIPAWDGLPAFSFPSIRAKAIDATSTSSCAGGSTGEVEVAYLKIGTKVLIGGPTRVAPNTVVKQGVLRIVLNEQIPSTGPGHGLTVNAVHIHAGTEALLGSEIVLGSARSGIAGC